MEEEQTIINKFFNYRQEKFIDEIENDMNLLATKLKDIKQEEIKKLIKNIPDEQQELKQKLTNSIENLVADYNIAMAYYNKKYYKQGFIDARWSGII